jgi:hypothetical protein
MIYRVEVVCPRTNSLHDSNGSVRMEPRLATRAEERGRVHDRTEEDNYVNFENLD